MLLKVRNELLFHLPKLSQFSKNVFYYDELTALASFNLAHPVYSVSGQNV